MFSTSQDIFYLVASSCLTILTVFLVICLYNLIKIMREVNEALERIHARLESVTSLFSIISNKIIKMGFGKVMEFAENLKEKKKKKK
ncbi:MAG: hypothetical protein WCT18_01010 [Patescibacteria group bacterium]